MGRGTSLNDGCTFNLPLHFLNLLLSNALSLKPSYNPRTTILLPGPKPPGSTNDPGGQYAAMNGALDCLGSILVLGRYERIKPL